MTLQVSAIQRRWTLVASIRPLHEPALASAFTLSYAPDFQTCRICCQASDSRREHHCSSPAKILGHHVAADVSHQGQHMQHQPNVVRTTPINIQAHSFRKEGHEDNASTDPHPQKACPAIGTPAWPYAHERVTQQSQHPPKNTESQRAPRIPKTAPSPSTPSQRLMNPAHTLANSTPLLSSEDRK